jgi:hypothetical protein
MRKVACTVLAVSVVVLCIGAGAAQAGGWAQQSPPNVNLLVGGLSGVSCTSPGACEAVGPSLAARWNGTEWTAQSLPNSIGGLNAVSCARADVCVAVGTDTAGGPIAARWDGSAWTAVPLPGGGNLAISCPTATFCMAVGGNAAESWDGTTWTPRPLAEVTTSDYLTSVSCTSPRACITVGGFVVERWNGARWASEPSPPDGFLNAVSCRSATWCIAVGGVGTGPYAARWNGRRWDSVRTQPPPPPLDDPRIPAGALDSVSCHGSFCVAAGTRIVYGSGPLLAAFAERWTGSEFRRTPPPLGDGGGSVLAANGLSCPTTGRCEAVGTQQDFSTRTASLAAEYFDRSPRVESA